jgi:hypothetical protein
MFTGLFVALKTDLFRVLSVPHGNPRTLGTPERPFCTIWSVLARRRGQDSDSLNIRMDIVLQAVK